MNKKQIEAEIKVKKEAIKQANRELSRLQEELKKSDKPYFKVAVRGISTACSFDLFDVGLRVITNKSMDEVKKLLESLSDPVEPKSYIDWEKVPEGYNWVAMDLDGLWYAYVSKPRLYENHVWFSDDAYKALLHDVVCESKNFRNSRIHRPGVKE